LDNWFISSFIKIFINKVVFYYPKMDNLINIAQVQKNEALLRKHIFTNLQLNVLKKKLRNQTLDSNEKTYYYKFIKPKVRALLAFSGIEETIIRGEEYILSERIIPARKIIQQMQKKHRRAKILISGSYLFNQQFNDIDVFIFSKYHKEDYRWKNIHINFLPETAINSLFFSSLCQISLSNFATQYSQPSTSPISLKDILGTYELLVNEILNKENFQKKLRDFIIGAEYIATGQILNPLQLYRLKNKFSRRNVLVLLQKYFTEKLALNYTKAELSLLDTYIHDYQKLSKEYKESVNLHNYIQTYQEVLELAS